MDASKNIKIIIFALCILCSQLSFSQGYNNDIKRIILTDLSTGKNVEIEVLYTGTSDTISIIGKHDVIKIGEAMDFSFENKNHIAVSLGKFLQITYGYRGMSGSGTRSKMTKYFCISDGHIIESMSLITLYQSWESFSGKLYEGDSLNVKIKHDNGSYLAYINQNCVIAYKRHFRKYVLKFDSIKHCFYTEKADSITARFSARGSFKSSLQKANNIFKITFINYKYLFYSNIWYLEGFDNKGKKCYSPI